MTHTPSSKKNNEWEKQMQSFIFFSLYIMAFPFKRSESWVSQGQSGEDFIRSVQRWRDSNEELSHTNKSMVPLLFILRLCTLQKNEECDCFFSVNLPRLSYTNWYIRTSRASMSDKKEYQRASLSLIRVYTDQPEERWTVIKRNKSDVKRLGG